MNQKNKEKLFTFLMILGIIIILLVGTFLLIYYYKYVEMVCPLPCEIDWGNFSSN